ncbi:MAG: MotA/TolQ/ExbB proton channel family protein [Saprospiraceae bacterium]|jgi:biopolymer transport protein ExbB|nr:MotA/TolQ/ExbB proton channel family protein [Saprospiraceae bacterium]HMT77703.1 MotA/TolQ/ExbB proton channel family protein [Saprospiraceae bacterium]HQU95814.1 MotA/TolQ/ExbB proton channel family protein [Saprospiraceae bacterium]HQW94626.1 MotA/TolQ/ExbB proton channel family protein [Saprospiraceae bacterium]HRG43881.1 MotA/TolQ/ExbB proton channel family protein [Saprospiraceae bacterium]
MQFFQLFFLQIVDTTAVQSISLPSQKLTFFDLLLKGGVIMIPLIILSIIAVGLMVERWLTINNLTKIEANFFNNIKSMLSNGNVKGAQDFAESNNTSIGKVISEGIRYIGYPYSEIETYMSDTANIELGKMENRLNYLGIIAGIAPMLGFVGTIAGIIKIFYNISITDNISIGVISGGLYEKMIASGTGLIVGILAFIGNQMLQSKIDRFALRMQDMVKSFRSVLLQKN